MCRLFFHRSFLVLLLPLGLLAGWSSEAETQTQPIVLPKVPYFDAAVLDDGRVKVSHDTLGISIPLGTSLHYEHRVGDGEFRAFSIANPPGAQGFFTIPLDGNGPNYFQARLYNGDAIGPPSDVFQISAGPSVAPSMVRDLRASYNAGSRAVTLNWQRPLVAGDLYFTTTGSYWVFRRDSTTNFIQQSIIAILGTRVFTYTDTDISSPNVEYSYQVWAVNSVGNTNTSVAISIPNLTTPVANADADQTVVEGVSVMLDGRGSRDADIGDVLSYRWEQIGGTSVSLTDERSATPTFIAPSRSAANLEMLTFRLTVTDLGNSNSTDEVTIAVLDDSPTAHLSIDSSSSIVREGEQFTFIATLDRAFPAELSFNWRTLEGSTATPALREFARRTGAANFTAVDGVDYRGDSGVLVFPPFQTQASFTVNTIDDDILKRIAFFTLELSEVATDPLPAGVNFTRLTRAAILDNEPISVLVSIDEVEADEGDDVIFFVNFHPYLVANGYEARLGWSTADGTAMANATTVVAGMDYRSTIGEDRFPFGATGYFITVPGREDNVVERDETFTLTFSTIDDLPAAVSFAGGAMNMIQATGRILNDDSAVIHIFDVSAQEGTDLVFPITMSQQVAEAVQVDWSIEPSNAEVREGEDYQGASGSIMIPAGMTTAAITVPSIEDNLFERDESFVVTLTLPDDFDGALSIDSTATATGTIEDNDGMRVAIADAAVMEGGTLSFAVSLSQQALGDLAFNVATADRSATAGDDYTAVNSVLTIPSGATGATVTVMSTEDTLVEGDEDFTVMLSAAGTLPARVFLGDDTAIGTIEDNDEAVVSIADARAVEGDALSFAVSLERAVAADVMLNWSTLEATATPADDDYTAVTNRILTIPAGETAAAITVMSIDDARVEEDESFTVEVLPIMGSGPIVTVNNTTATGVIENDDTATMTIDDAAITEGGDLVFAIQLTQAAAVDIGLTWSTSDDTATANADYRPATDVALTIPAGDRSAAIIVTSREDTLVEEDENFTVTLSVTTALPSGVTFTDPIATGTIEENDTATMTIDDATGTEGDDFIFAIRLTKASAVDIGLTWSTSDGTATAGRDYTAVTNRALTIPAGSTETEIIVTSLTDRHVERDEDFTVTLSTVAALPAGIILTDPIATGTITPMNHLPIATFIWPATVMSGDTVTLDGSGSSDPDGDDGNLTYIWSYLGAEERGSRVRVDVDVTLDLTDPVRPTFVAPNVPVGTATDLIVSLVVRDELGGESRPKTLLSGFAILVLSNDDPVAVIEVSTPHAIIPGNRPPTLPTPLTAVFLEGETVTLDSSSSVDPLGQGLTYRWVVFDDSNILTGVRTSAVVTLVTQELPDTGASHRLDVVLEVTDAAGNESVTAAVIILVVSQPMAEAGDPQTVAEGATVTLNGEESIGHIDPISATPLIYSWRQTGGTPTVDLENADTARATFTAPGGVAAGTMLELEFELKITTEFTVSASDTVAITVEDAVEITAPDNQTYTTDTAITDLTLPEATGGTGTATYTLTGPSSTALATAVPGLNFDANNRTLSGTPTTATAQPVTLTYTATDDNGSIAMDTFTVTVAAGVEVTVPGDQTYTIDTAITDLTLDPATGGTGDLTYMLMPLPDGLDFDVDSRVLSGTPIAMETVEAIYTATDNNGASQSATFTITVADGLALNAPSNQTYTMDTAITDLSLPEATGGTTPLTYTLMPLPTGLTFTASTRTLSGTPTAMEEVMPIYTVTDNNSASQSATFTITVANGLALNAPSNQTYTMDTAITDLSLPEATGGTTPLTYTLTPLPDGLTFTASTRTLSGTPTAMEEVMPIYTVTDNNSASQSATFTITVANGLALNAPSNQTYTMDTAITDLSLPEATGGTTPLTYTLMPLPDGLTFTASTRTLSGTPTTTQEVMPTYTVTDNNGASQSATFTITVANGLALNAPSNQTYTMDTAITDLSLPEATGGTTPLTYTLMPLPDGLTFTASTRTLSGTPTAMEEVMPIYTVTDNNGASQSATFTITVANGLALNAPSNQTYTMDTAITDLSLPEATGGTTPLTYTLMPLPTGLNFNAGTRTLSGTPTAMEEVMPIYTVTDNNGASQSATFTITVANGLALNAPSNQTYTMDTAITDLPLPEATGGTTPLTYTLMPLPTGLNFNASTRTLSGTPTAMEEVMPIYTVTDDNGASQSATFTITVANGLALNTPSNQTYTMDTAITDLTLPEATGGTTPLTYTLIPLPTGLNFNASTRVLSGTPTAMQEVMPTYTVTDNNSASQSATFTITVANGLALNAPSNQTYTMNTAITDLTLDPATGGTTPLTYTLSPLPTGLNFNASTRVLSGTPTTMQTITATYTATDNNNSIATDTFTITVAARVAVTAPVDQTYTMNTAITDLILPEATGGTTPLTYTLSPLPTGLNFNATTRVLSGTPTTMQTITATYTATDNNNSIATATFTITVAARVAVTAPDDQTYTMNTAITDLILPEATGGTTPLTYTLMPLPTGLNFNASTRVLSGTPTTMQTITATYTATDNNNSIATATFTITVANGLALNAPSNQTYTMDTAITDLTLDMATGGTTPLTYTLMPLPTGLNFNASTRVLSGTPTTMQTITATYTATDNNNSIATATFTITVANGLVLNAPSNQTYTMDTAITDLTLDPATGGTTPLTYTLMPLPTGLNFNADTRVLSGTPTTMQTITATYTATDNNNSIATATFTVTVAAGVAVTAPGDQTYTMDATITDLTLPEATGGTTPLTYTLMPLPTGLNFNASTRVLSGTPTTMQTITATYTAMDNNNSIATATFTITVANGLALNAPSNQTYTMDTAITDLTLDMATGGTTPLTYTLMPLPTGLNFNAGTRVLSGTPTTMQTITATYTATDNNNSIATATFIITVANGLVLNAPNNQTYTMNTAITALPLAPATGGTSPLTYMLASLPNGLTFDADSRVLSGTPNAMQTVTATYTATDSNGASQSATFTITVANGLALNAPGNQTYTMNTAITNLALPIASGGTGTVTYTLAPLPNGLTFTVGTRVLSGTPTTMETVTAIYTAMDTNGSTAMDTFTITVANGLALNAPGNQTYTTDMAITNLALPMASGGTGTVTYTLAPLPNGLTFIATTRVLSGTPTTMETVTATYTAMDTNGSTAMDTFTITVANRLALNAPGNQTYTMNTAITNLALPMASGGTGTVTYTLTPLPDGLNFNATTRVLSGTPTTMQTITATYTAMDTNGSTAMATFTITVANRLALNAPGNQTYTMNTAITDLALPMASGGTGTVTYTLAPLPNGLTFTAGTRVLSGTPTTMETVTVIYTAMDTNGSTAMDTFTITVANGLALNAPGNQTYTMNTAITNLALPMATGGTGTVTYTLAPLPNGLTFIATTRVLSGTPTTMETVTATYTAMDTNSSTAMATFTITVANGLALSAPGNQTYTTDMAITNLALPMASGGTGTVTYTLAPLPTGLTFIADPRVLSGTPNAEGETELTYTAMDENGSMAIAAFVVIISADVTVSDPSIVAGVALNAPGNQTYTVDTEITPLTMPEATGGTGTVTYTLTPLPDGLNFDDTGRVLSGTPTTVGRIESTYTATDGNSTDSVTFIITVIAIATADDLSAARNEMILPEVTRALADRTVSPIKRRIEQANLANQSGQAAGVTIGGQRSLSGVLMAHGEPMANGTHALKDLLGDSDFVLPLNAGAAAESSSVLWGDGAYRDLSGDSGGLDWDGELSGVHIGFDARVHADMLAGVAVSWLRGDLDYEYNAGRLDEGEYKIDLTGVHPYFGWSGGVVDVWATVGYGEGDLEITEAGPAARSSDFSLRTLSIGGSGRVWQRGTTEVRVKSEVVRAELVVDGNANFTELEVDVTRVRLSMEAKRKHELAGGGVFSPSLEVGVRYDGGDGQTGGGMEVGVGLHYSNPAKRVTVEGRVRTLLDNDGEYEKWGISGQVKLLPGADGQGFSFGLSPGYGESGSDLQALWDHGVSDAAGGDATADYRAYLDAKIGYGVSLRGLEAVLTPYGEMTLGSQDSYRVGMKCKSGTRYEVTLLGERREGDGADEHTILLKGEIRF